FAFSRSACPAPGSVLQSVRRFHAVSTAAAGLFGEWVTTFSSSISAILPIPFICATGLSTGSSRAQGRVAVHYPTADQRRHVAHAAPRMSRRALEPEIVPGVLSTWRIGRHYCEGVKHDGEIELGGCGVERL